MANANEKNAPRRKKSQKRPGVFSSVYFAKEAEYEEVKREAAAAGVSVNEYLVTRALRRARRGRKAA